MSKIKGVGAPTRKTKGGIGDIYIDQTTGKKYKCTGSYGSARYEAEYDWKAVNEPVKNGPNPVAAKETKMETKVDETPVKEVEVEVEVEEKAEEVAEEITDETSVEEPKKPKQNKQRTNYAAAYNKK